MARLPEAMRRLLEVVAVAGRPIPLSDACQASGWEGDERPALAYLRSGRLLRTTGSSLAPTVETYIVPSSAAPSGVGEPGTCVIAPAVANALLALTGKPTTSLPFVKS